MSAFIFAMLAITNVWRLLLTIALLGTLTSTVFLFMVMVAAVRYRVRSSVERRAADGVADESLPKVTVLKPVHGMEPLLEQNLESFLRQDYPDFEIIFGAREADNDALQVAESVRARYPHVKSKIVISGMPTWPNAKVFSLDRMISASSSDYFVISDSDVCVEPRFLRNVIAPLLDPAVGLVTCPYRGIPSHDLWSSLEALGMSVEMPSGVMVADMMEGMRFAMGAVMAVRRDALDKIGGIGATADYYSDDFVLGNEVWAAGYKVVLSHEIVGHVLIPRSFVQTFGDQLRWMKSTRYSRPKGHLGSGLTFAMPFGLLGWIAAGALGSWPLGVLLLLAAFVNRVSQSIVVGWGVIGDSRALRYCWLYPLRDLIGFYTWMASFTSRTFFWRGETYRFSDGGRIIPQHRPAVNAVPNQM
ncbi:MAG TPA: bacteriohopanetetrol glucosamine biosynthesis glycosyltransferase HpnI [Terriglobales bacterium]|jgi:ceramide glucosyltransferase